MVERIEELGSELQRRIFPQSPTRVILASDISQLFCPGPRITSGPTLPNRLPLQFAETFPDAAVQPGRLVAGREEANAAVLK